MIKAFGHYPFALLFLAYIASNYYLMFRLERLKRLRHRGAGSAPSPLSFHLGGAMLWIWSDAHRDLGDERISRAVRLNRLFLVSALAAWALGYVWMLR
jgi:hypothetical protein